MMTLAKPFKVGTHKVWRRACRPAWGGVHRLAARLRPGMRPWGRPSRPIRRLVTLASRIVEFHETEPLLAGVPQPCRPSQVNDHPPEKMNTPKIEKRTDSVQFWTDSNAPNLWSRQANEPAADYQLFVAWLQRPAPRFFRPAAKDLDCSLHRLRRLSVRHR